MRRAKHAAATAVVAQVQQGRRPGVPEDCPALVEAMMVECWQHDPQVRRVAVSACACACRCGDVGVRVRVQVCAGVYLCCACMFFWLWQRAVFGTEGKERLLPTGLARPVFLDLRAYGLLQARGRTDARRPHSLARAGAANV